MALKVIMMIHHDNIAGHHDYGLYYGDVCCHHRSYTQTCVYEDRRDDNYYKGWRHDDDGWQGVIPRHGHIQPKTFQSWSKLSRVLTTDHHCHIIKRKHSLIVTFNSPTTGFIENLQVDCMSTLHYFLSVHSICFFMTKNLYLRKKNKHFLHIATGSWYLSQLNHLCICLA